MTSDKKNIIIKETSGKKDITHPLAKNKQRQIKITLVDDIFCCYNEN